MTLAEERLCRGARRESSRRHGAVTGELETGDWSCESLFAHRSPARVLVLCRIGISIGIVSAKLSILYSSLQ